MKYFHRFFYLLAIFALTYATLFSINKAFGNTYKLDTSQICTDNICQIPATDTTANSPATITNNIAQTDSPDVITNKSNTGNEIISTERVIFSGSLISSSISFWLIGLLLSFTPCVLPLLILISSFLGVNNTIPYTRSIMLGITYIISMSLTFAITGTLAAHLGIYMHPYFQNPWIISIFSLILAILALSLLGLYQIRLPDNLRHYIARHNKLQSNYHFLEVAFMGILATLITSPCVAAPLVGILSYIGHTGNLGLGSVGLFSLGLGIGTPLLAAIFIRKQFLPQGIFWQHFIKYVIGLSLLGMSIYISARIIPSSWNMLIWSVFVVFTANYMLSLTSEQMGRSLMLLWKSMSMIVLTFGMLIFMGYFLGSRSPLHPLSALITTTPFHDRFYIISGLNSFDNALVNAAHRNKSVLIYFTSRWCESCINLETNVLNDEHIMAIMNDFILLKVELNTPNSPSHEIAKKYSISGTPEIIFFTSTGNLSQHRIIGSTSKITFKKILLTVENEK